MSDDNQPAIQSSPHCMPADLLHDLRSPLGPILGYSELLIEQMHEAGNADFIPYVEKIRCAANKLLTMMNDNLTAGP